MTDSTLDQALLADIQKDFEVYKTRPDDVELRKTMLTKQVELTQKQLGVTNQQAANVVRSYSAAYAQTKGIDPKDFINALTADERRILNFSETDGKIFNIDPITANKIALILAGGSIIVLGASAIALIIASITVGPEIAAAAAGGGGVATILGVIFGSTAGTTAAVGTLTGVIAFLFSQALGHFASLIPMVTKQIIDYGSIGPGLRIKALIDAEHSKSIVGDPNALLSGAIKSGFAPHETTRIQSSMTAKPKLFTGIVYNGQVGKYDQFVRAVDDHITSDADLKSDVEINLLRYISKIPNNLSYSIQIKNSPSDELGIPRTGTWATLSIYLTNQFHKRVFIDEILLGPVDPFVYYPEAQKVQQLQYDIPKIVKFETLHPMDEYRGQEHIVDKEGNVITNVLHDGTQVVASAKVSGTETPLTSVMQATHVIATPNSISADGVFQHNQPPLFVSLYRLRNNEMLSYAPYSDLYTQAEKDKLSQDPGKFAGNEQRLKDRGVNTAQIRAVQYLDLEGVGRHPDRAVGFAEFFGAVAQTHEFPKNVHVVVDRLNVRSEPTSQSAVTGSRQLVRGDVFTAVALVEGESVSGNNKWYKSSLGHFVWSGGTN